MTGAERLEQALTDPLCDGWTVARVREALDGCVLLTAEEADSIRRAASQSWGGSSSEHDRILAPLTPQDKPVGDIGPPAPGEGDGLPNPELGMKC